MVLKNNIKIVLLILLVLGQTMVFATDVKYSDFFTKDVLRVDLTHSGTLNEEFYFTEGFCFENNWAGTYTKLIDESGFGDNYFEVYDSSSTQLIYSRGYNNIFYEWQETAEAKLTNRSFEEVIRCPFPQQTVSITIFRRLANGELKALHQFYVNPNSYRLNKEVKHHFETEWISGKLPTNKAIDVVILPDGYTKEELDLFRNDAKKLSAFLLNTAPFNQVKEQFNFRIVLADSKESGTDIPGDDIWKNTVLNSHFYTFNGERYLTSQSLKKISDVAAQVPYDQVYILVNSAKYGGGGIYNYYNLTSAHHVLTPWVFIHEFGHGFAGLADEYYDGSTAYTDIYDLDTEPWRANISTLKHPEKKWKHMVDKSVPIPTPATKEYANKVGFFEGGGYVAKGIYRPYQNCEMKSLQQGFCPVCQAAILNMVKMNTDD